MTIQKPRGDDESINICPTYVSRITKRLASKLKQRPAFGHSTTLANNKAANCAVLFCRRLLCSTMGKPLGEGRQQDMHDLPSTHDGISHLLIHSHTDNGMTGKQQRCRFVPNLLPAREHRNISIILH